MLWDKSVDVYDHLDVSIDGRGVLSIRLDHPETGNTIDSAIVHDLLSLFESVALTDRVRLVVLGGSGEVFSRGTDPDFLEMLLSAPRADVVREARNLASLFDLIDGYPKPVVGVVHGQALGEAMGLLAACDVVVASSEAVFQMPESRMGLVGACVAPFVIAKIGGSFARSLFISGRAISARRAYEMRLVHEVVPSPADLEKAVELWVEDILQGGPEAHKVTKRLIRRLTYHGHSVMTSDTLEDVATCTADSCGTDEAREGIHAAREGRKPAWVR